MRRAMGCQSRSAFGIFAGRDTPLVTGVCSPLFRDRGRASSASRRGTGPGIWITS